MIFEYKQIDTEPNIQQAVYKDRVIAEGTSFGFFSGSIHIENCSYTLTTYEGQILIVDINNNCVGEIKEKLFIPENKKWYDRGVIYYDFHINNQKFVVYHIGFYKKNHNFYQFVENGKTVAMIQKLTKVVNRKHRYICYSENEDMVEYMSLWCLFLQSSAFYPFMTAGEGNVSKGYGYHSPKSERDYFDPEFIERVKAQEGITE